MQLYLRFQPRQELALPAINLLEIFVVTLAQNFSLCVLWREIDFWGNCYYILYMEHEQRRNIWNSKNLFVKRTKAAIARIRAHIQTFSNKLNKRKKKSENYNANSFSSRRLHITRWNSTARVFYWPSTKRGRGQFHKSPSPSRWELLYIYI